MKQTEFFIVTRLYREDLKSEFPEIPEETLDAVPDEVMETIARRMHEADLAGAFLYRLRLIAEEMLAA